jgi:hypothetical protein
MKETIMASINDHSRDISTQEVRQGKELGSVRWVLRISLGLAVLAGVLIYFSYANFFHA